jgi:hypothetical protein
MESIKIFKKTTFFLLPLLIIVVLFEVSLRRIPNDYSFKREHLLQQADSIETLILGSSHTFYGVIPEYLSSKAYNLSYVSQSVLFDNLLFKQYYKDLPKLKHVVIPVAYPTLSHKFNEGEEKWRKYNYYRYHKIAPPEQKWYHKYYFELDNLPFKKNIEKLFMHATGRNIITCKESGWGFYYSSEDVVRLEESAKPTAERHENNNMNFCHNVELLREIFEICDSEGIEVTLVIFPLWKDYLDYLNPDKLKKMVRTCEELDILYENVDFYNFMQDERFVAYDFYDVDHLNDKGAKKFTIILDSLLIKQK